VFLVLGGKPSLDCIRQDRDVHFTRKMRALRRKRVLARQPLNATIFYPFDPELNYHNPSMQHLFV
jgi:hypothetical protein